MELVVTLLLMATAFSLLVEIAQLLMARLFLARREPEPTDLRPISILKPMCGLDDELAQNLQTFLDQDYPDYELLLGLASESDPAAPVARALERAHPGRVRVVMQRGEPGLNPKVNQLCTLGAEARHEWVLISDSNVRVERGYLKSIAAHLADPKVGLVTHPAAGIGGARLGSRLDNLQLTASVLLGLVSVKQGVGQDLVVGKSMALRKADVRALGGFEAYADFLAEDFLIGQHTSKKLGKRVALAKQPVFHVTVGADVRGFWRRFTRWSVMQRRTVGLFTYSLQIFLNPVALATAAALVHPTLGTLGVLAGACALRILFDGAFCVWMEGDRFDRTTALLAPLKDVIMAFAWLYGQVVDQINWRGHPLRVTAGSKLERADDAELEESEVAVTPAGGGQ